MVGQGLLHHTSLVHIHMCMTKYAKVLGGSECVLSKKEAHQCKDACNYTDIQAI